MAERPESIIEPIPPSTNPVLERFFDYLNEPLRTEDPLKNLLAGVIGTDKRMGAGDFIPGLSQALARRRGDKLGEALSYLDYIPGGGTGVKLGSIFLIERKRQLEKALRDLNTDPILKMNPDAGKTLQKQLDEVNQQIATDKETAKRYGEMTDEILGGGKSSPSSPLVTKFSDDRAALVKELEKAREKVDSLSYDKLKSKFDGNKYVEAVREQSGIQFKIDAIDKSTADFFNATNKTQKDIIFEIFAEGGNQARKAVKRHPELAAEYINKGNVISPVKGVDYSQGRGLEPPGFTPNFPMGREQGTFNFEGITSQLPKRDEIFGPNIPKGERDFRNFSANITIDDIIEVVDRQEKQRRKRGDYTDEELTRMLFGKKPKE
jgi:hypothetical protein